MAELLLRRISVHIDDAMLTRIARSDAGLNTIEHFDKLESIRDQSSIDRPCLWRPREVLELTAWREPDGTDSPGSSNHVPNLYGHWERAYCCVAATLTLPPPPCR